jgi:hypothetical protein
VLEKGISEKRKEDIGKKKGGYREKEKKKEGYGRVEA